MAEGPSHREPPQRGRVVFGEFVAAVGGVALFTVLSFNWYRGEELGFGVGVSAWRAFAWIDVILALLAALAVSHALLRAAGVELDRMPLAFGGIVTMAGAVAVCLVVFRWVDLPDEVGADRIVSRRIGPFLALVAALGIVLGSMMAVEERGERWRPRGGGR